MSNNKPGNFFRTNKLVILWTIYYFIALGALLYFMFGFNLLSPDNWAKLMHVRLSGLPGLSFSIVILAALPVYIATLYYIVKNKKTPIPVPGCIPEPPSAKATGGKSPTATEASPDPEIAVPTGLPREMREPYMRIARGQPLDIYSVYSLPDAEESVEAETAENAASGAAPDAAETAPQYELPGAVKGGARPPGAPLFAEHGDTISPINIPKNISDEAPAGAFPIPTDFDAEPTAAAAAPVFKEISFGRNNNVSSRGVREANEPGPAPRSPGEGGTPLNQPGTKNSEIAQTLSAKGYKTKVLGEIIIATPNDSRLTTHDSRPLAIAVHDDPEFWIADGDEWFATGRQKHSPVAMIIAAAKEFGAEPVLHLMATNIMDLDVLCEKWADDGITVIKNLSEL
ncbi:MAG: hypothetical protein FWC51_01985 [Proteobacteria bacterium]|nr:hypothetical protein [Pseudomonadota bacterium]